MTNKNAVLIHPELSYKIIGATFKIYNNLGWGHKEITYQRALAVEFNNLGLKFEREKFVSIEYDNRKIGREFLDFVVDGKIIVELKVIPKFGYIHINQVVSYLKNTGLSLAILVYFTKDGVRYRRIVRSS